MIYTPGKPASPINDKVYPANYIKKTKVKAYTIFDEIDLFSTEVRANLRSASARNRHSNAERATSM